MGVDGVNNEGKIPPSPSPRPVRIPLPATAVNSTSNASKPPVVVEIDFDRVEKLSSLRQAEAARSDLLETETNPSAQLEIKNSLAAFFSYLKIAAVRTVEKHGHWDYCSHPTGKKPPNL